MFKSLREKISTVDSNTRKNKPSSNNGDSSNIEDENQNDILKNSGNQNLSRFSSISSLVSEVGVAFTKSMTTTQHVQPSNSGLKARFDNDSISEYDDSVSGGETFTKEELFMRYQRAASFAKRYKTQYLEVVEGYKKLKADNTKLSQTLSDAQDKQFRRINELKEQIDLDKKAKQDVEENYSLMIDEKMELVNVLKLQVNLLKEGKDLPPELEEQIKQKHEIEVLSEKKKEDEIKELKSMLSQRENLLQRCKDKINSLNSQLDELKMKFSNIADISNSNENSKPLNFASLTKHSQQICDIESGEKEHSERIQNLLKEFEEKRCQMEIEMIKNFEKDSGEIKSENQLLKEKIKNLYEENESLAEQVNIKINIIQDLMKDSITKPDDYNNRLSLSSLIDKLKRCKVVLNKYPEGGHPALEEFSSILNSVKATSMIEVSSCYEYKTDEFTEQIVVSNETELARINDLEDQNKHLLSRIEQLEKLKMFCEEENTFREKELQEQYVVVEEERKMHTAKCRSFEIEIDKLKSEYSQLVFRNEEILAKQFELETEFIKNTKEKESLDQEKELLLAKCQANDDSISLLELEKNNLMDERKKICEDYNDMQLELVTTRAEYESNQSNLTEKTEECRLLLDRIDEIMSSLDRVTLEKNELLIAVMKEKVDMSTQEDRLSLNIVEMQQRFDQEIEELNNRLIKNDELNENKSVTIVQLESQLKSFKEIIDNSKEDLENLNNVRTNLNDVIRNNEELLVEKENLVQNLINISQENESLKLRLEGVTLENNTLKEETKSLLNTIKKKDTERQNTDDKMESLSNCYQNLVGENTKFLTEKDEITTKFNETLIELEKEITEKVVLRNDLDDNIKALQSLDVKYNELMGKYESVTSECASVNEKLQFMLKENEELVNGNIKINEEKIILYHQCETYKNEIAFIQDSTITDKDLLCRLKEEIRQLTSDKETLENKIRDSEKSCKLLTNEKNNLDELYSESFEIQKLAVEKVERENIDAIKKLETIIKDYRETIEKNNAMISDFQELINNEKKRTDEEIKIKCDLMKRVDVLESYITVFSNSIGEVLVIAECDGQCYHTEEQTLVCLDVKLELECEEYDAIKLLGKRIENTLQITHRFHSKLHNCQQTIMNANQSIQDICEIFQGCIDNNETSEDIPSQLNFIKNSLLTLKFQLDEKSSILSQIESQCLMLNDALDKENLPVVQIIADSSPICELEMKIIHTMNNLQKELLIKNELYAKTNAEFEIIEGKLEKSTSLSNQIFKQLISMFHFTEINISQLTDHKSIRKILMKRLKEYVKQHEQLLDETNESKSKLDNTERDLKIAVELNENIQSELDDLKNSVANDRDRLHATREELENSLRRLNEVADEKGRIDEEKQSLRKELKELNEKISYLKLDFEKQSLEKQRLEIQFDESLEKVKTNHTALEEMYKKELEKQHGYQRNLEEQIASHKESSSFKLSESERKLEEVLNQSEQLLELNNQYKKLLDETKMEANDVLSTFNDLEKQNRELKSQLDQLKSENKGLNESIGNLQMIQEEIDIDRNSLKNDLTILQTATITSTESVKNLQKVNDEKDEEWEKMKMELSRLKLTNESLNNKLKIFESTHDEMVEKEKLMTSELSELTIQKNDCGNVAEILKKNLDDLEIEYRNVESEKSDLLAKLNVTQTDCDRLKAQNNESKILINKYKNQIEDLNLDAEQMKTRFEMEKDELEQQFNEDKSNIEDDYNRRVKKLAKEFNDRMFEKERDFQKTFEEALSSIRKDETRMKTDFKSTVDELNKSSIEIQIERNQLLDQITEHEVTIDNMKKLIDKKDIDLESFRIKIEEYTKNFGVLEKENEALKLQKISKMNQTMDSGTYYEQPLIDSVGIKDHEVLLMHCSDIEEQLRQLHAENTNLKKSAAVNAVISSSESTIYVSKSKHLTNQQSISSDPSKTPVIYHSGSFRSPNTSSSDYMFCPIPITEATDYEYLHDVLLKYMTGLETEVLAKVVCTVMKFSSDETNRVLSFEQYRNKFIRKIL